MYRISSAFLAAILMTAAPSALAQSAPTTSDIDFGNDSSHWANDGECDDPRFTGPDLGTNIDDDIKRDATDCRASLEAGDIQFNAAYLSEDDRPKIEPPAGLEFGNDSSKWANDEDCDDPRFVGEDAPAKQIPEDIGRDASDCETSFALGKVTLADGALNVALPERADIASINFGNNSSEWSHDDECDDPRFAGNDSAAKVTGSDQGHDAKDCRAAYRKQTIWLK